MADTGSFSGTFTGTWSTTKIDLTAGTGTLDQLFTDINDATVMSRTGVDPYDYVVEQSSGGSDRELELSIGVTLNMQNDSDTLGWDLSAHQYPILDIQAGATFNVGDGTAGGDNQTIIGDINDTYYSYIYVYGSFNCQGTAGGNVTIEKYRSMYFYTDNLEGDVCDWDYVTLQEPTYASGYMLYFDGVNIQAYPAHTFHNVTVTGAGEGQVYFNTGFNGVNCTFDNIDFDNIDRIYFYSAGGVKFTNSTFQNIDSYAPLHYGACGMNTSHSHYDTTQTQKYPTTYQQPFGAVYDTCTFDSNYDTSTQYASYAVARGSTALYKDCTFQNVAYGVYAYENGIALYAGTNTFNSIGTADRRWGSNGTHLHCRTLDLTIYEDDGATPLPDAMVTIRQKEGNEIWHFKTDASGNIKNLHGDLPVFVEKEETSTGVYTQWSDGVGARKHQLLVIHPDYAAHAEDIEFTSDKTITVTMALSESGVATTIYDSTLYDTVVY